MSTYEGTSDTFLNIPCIAHLKLYGSVDDHSIPHDSDPTTGTNPSQPSPYAARDAPRTFEEFMAELQRIVGAVRFGEERNTQGRRQPDGGGLMMDEDLYDEVFGDMDAFGGK